MHFKAKNILKNSRYYTLKQHILYMPPQMEMWVGFLNIFLLILYVTKDIL
jgi:hypothetical protein